jgi:zinc finger HIT domain-containing protein 1
MATGSLRFRTGLIEELPTTQVKNAPGFAWVAVSGRGDDPSKNWGTTNRKRVRTVGTAQTESQREAVSAKQQEKIDRRIRELNSDGGREVAVPHASRKEGGTAHKAGKTTNTKKILASGKTLAHYLDDEEAEIARNGRRDIDMDTTVAAPQRASKTPLARRKPQHEVSVASGSPVPPVVTPTIAGSIAMPTSDVMDVDVPHADHDDDDDDDEFSTPPMPSRAEIETLLNATPLTYAQARAAPPPANTPPARKFCETCGYWGRVRCMKCNVMTCSVTCKDIHDEHKCLKFYA